MKKNQRIFYRWIDRDMKSWSIRNKNIAVRSKMGKWTYPKVKGSKLFVFDKDPGTLVDSRLFKCIVKSPKKKRIMLGAFGSENVNKVKRFWTGNRQSLQTVPIWRDVVVCDAFKLIEEIK